MADRLGDGWHMSFSLSSSFSYFSFLIFFSLPFLPVYSFLLLGCFVDISLLFFFFSSSSSYHSEWNFLTRQNYPVTMETLAVRTWRPGIQFQHWSLPPLTLLLLLLPLFYCFQRPSTTTPDATRPPPLIYSCFRAQTGSSLEPAPLQRREIEQAPWAECQVSSKSSSLAPAVSVPLSLSPALKNPPKLFSFLPDSAIPPPLIFIYSRHDRLPQQAPDPHHSETVSPTPPTSRPPSASIQKLTKRNPPPPRPDKDVKKKNFHFWAPNSCIWSF